MMNFKDYQDEAAKYADGYPKGREIEYLTLGLVAAWGELLTAKNQWFEQIADVEEETELARKGKRYAQQATSRLWWYAAMLARRFGITEASDIPSRLLIETTTITVAAIAGNVLHAQSGVPTEDTLKAQISGLLIDLMQWSTVFKDMDLPTLWQLYLDLLKNREAMINSFYEIWWHGEELP